MGAEGGVQRTPRRHDDVEVEIADRAVRLHAAVVEDDLLLLGRALGEIPPDVSGTPSSRRTISRALRDRPGREGTSRTSESIGRDRPSSDATIARHPHASARRRQRSCCMSCEGKEGCGNVGTYDAPVPGTTRFSLPASDTYRAAPTVPSCSIPSRTRQGGMTGRDAAEPSLSQRRSPRISDPVRSPHRLVDEDATLPATARACTPRERARWAWPRRRRSARPTPAPRRPIGTRQNVRPRGLPARPKAKGTPLPPEL